MADGQLAPLQLRLISHDHTPHLRSFTLTSSISHLGELRLQYGLSISAFFVQSFARFMGLAVPIRYTLMGLPLHFSFPEHMYFLLALAR